ncbi:MAG: hypothetical protein ACYCOU_03350 [Sulfobacillus sp.]
MQELSAIESARQTNLLPASESATSVIGYQNGASRFYDTLVHLGQQKLARKGNSFPDGTKEVKGFSAEAETNYQTPWHRLSQAQQVNRLLQFAEQVRPGDKQLSRLLVAGAQSRCLTHKSDVIYDDKEAKVVAVPKLAYIDGEYQLSDHPELLKVVTQEQVVRAPANPEGTAFKGKKVVVCKKKVVDIGSAPK